MTNTDYKILAYILTNHLQPHLSALISSQQTAYMKGCFIGTNIRSVQDFIYFLVVNGKDHVVLFLAFKKAFDSVSHHFLFLLLEHIGLPALYIECICIMYSNASSVLWHKNWLTPKFSLGRGVWQGYPLSCHLFNLVGQVLLYSMRDCGLFQWWTKLGDLDSQYADDIALLVENCNSLPKIIEYIQWVGKFTSLKLNLDKMIAFTPHLQGRYIVHGIQMSNEPVKYLGVFLGVGDLTTMNFEKPLHQAHAKIRSWNACNLTLQARVVVVKTYL